MLSLYLQYTAEADFEASWPGKGLKNGSHLRTGINSAPSLPVLRQLIADFFGVVSSSVSF